MSSINLTKGKVIHFLFHPKDYDSGLHAIEKADSGGNKRKYLFGVSSGVAKDAHGERMTQNAINSFMEQANKGQILLFPDIHGIKESEDIGTLAEGKILPNNDWFTSYRLYDELDDIGPMKLEKISTLWKQINGLPPYVDKEGKPKPRQKGFSIEGTIPEEAIKYTSEGKIDRSVIDDIVLDGVLLVPRPAYQTGIANAIYKAFNEVSPERKNSLQGHIREALQKGEIADNFYKVKWDYQNALEELIEKIMQRKNNHKKDELSIIFEEYKNLMVPLILSSEELFVKEQDELEESQGPYDISVKKGAKDFKLELLESLYANLLKLTKVN